MRTIYSIVSFTVMSSSIAFAEVATPEPDKGSHWLFEPTPKEMMRGLAPGDTPYTVDAGHVQLEVDAVDTAWVRDGDTRGRETSVGFTAKVGLLPRVDLHVHYSPYNHVRRFADDGMSSVAGSGDVEAHVKFNVLNPEGGTVALAIMPYISIPTGDAEIGAGAIEAGIVAPFWVEGPLGFTFAVVGSAGVAHDDEMRARPVVGATVGFTHLLWGSIGMVVEDAISVSTERSAEHLVNTGITIGIDDDVELDTGVRLSVPDPRAAINPYVSIIWRR